MKIPLLVCCPVAILQISQVSSLWGNNTPLERSVLASLSRTWSSIRDSRFLHLCKRPCRGDKRARVSAAGTRCPDGQPLTLGEEVEEYLCLPVSGDGGTLWV